MTMNRAAVTETGRAASRKRTSPLTETLERRLLLTGLPFGQPELTLPWDVSDFAIDNTHHVVYVAVPSQQSIKLLDTQTLEPLGEIGSVDAVRLAITPDGSRLFGYDYDAGSIAVIDTGARAIERTVKAAAGVAWMMAGRDGALYTNALQSSFGRMDPQTGAWSFHGNVTNYWNTDASMHPLQDVLYVKADGGVVAWDVSDGTPSPTTTGFYSLPVFSSDGTLVIASVTQNSPGVLMDSATLTRRGSFQASEEISLFSEDARLIYSAPLVSAPHISVYDIQSDTTIASGAGEQFKRLEIGGSGSHLFQRTGNDDAQPSGFRVLNASPTQSPAAMAVTWWGWDIMELGQSLRLDGSRSSGLNGSTITGYSWDINNDGIFGDATGVQPTVTWEQLKSLGFTQPGQSLIHLEISGADFAPTVSHPGYLIIRKSASAPQIETVGIPVPVGSIVPVKVTVPQLGVKPTGTVDLYQGDELVGTAALDSANSASFSVTLPLPGSRILKAVYSGDDCYIAQESTAWLEVTGQVSSTVTLTQDGPLDGDGHVTLKAAIGPAGVPTFGEVEFYLGSTLLGRSWVDGTGIARFRVPQPLGGSQTFTARYPGNQYLKPSEDSVTLALPRLTPRMVALFLYAGTPQVGLRIDTASTTKATGTVRFYENDQLIYETTLDANAQAVMPVIDPPPGPRSFKISYLGDSRYLPGETFAIVNYGATTTELTIDQSGGALWARASVRDVVNYLAYGEMSFFVDGVLQSRSAITTAQTSLLLPTLSVGSHVITAKYHGGSIYAPSSSEQTVEVKATNISLVSSTGQYPASVTALVSTSDGEPVTGSIHVMAGTKDLGNFTLSSTGEAVISLSSLPAGAHTVTASYARTLLLGASSKSISVTAPLSPTMTSLSITQVNGVQSARVVVTFDPRSLKGTSEVSILVDGTLTARGPLSAAGVFTASLPTLSVGSHTVTAQYSGCAYTAPSSSEQTVEVKATNISLVSSTGQYPASVTALVSTSDGEPVTGSIHVMAGTKDLGNFTLSSAGEAIISLTSLPGGAHTLTVSYARTALLGASSKSISVTVPLSPTTTSVSITQVNGVQSARVVVTFDPRSLKGTSEVLILVDGTLRVRGPLSAAGVFTASLPTLSIGSHTVTAQYSGCAYTAPSSASRTLVLVGSSVALTPSSGQFPATITAQVTSSNGTPVSGSIYVTIAGRADMGNIALNSSGRATISLVTLPAGTYTLTARYAGTADLAGSSKTITVTQPLSPTTTALTITQVNGTPTARVVVTFDSRSLKAAAEVRILIDDTLHARGPLSPTGEYTLSLPPLAAGSHKITAQYSGCAYTAASAASKTIQTAATAITLQQSGDSIKAHVLVGANPAAGKVQFFVDGISKGLATLNASGDATFTPSALAPGSHTILAKYAGTALAAPASATIAVRGPSIPTTTAFSGINEIGALVTVRAAGYQPRGTVLLWVDDTLYASSGFPDPSFDTREIAPGRHRVYAEFRDTTGAWQPSRTPTVELTIRRPTVLRSALNVEAITVGSDVTISAVVLAGFDQRPTGTIEVYDGSVLLGSAQLLNGSVSLTVKPQNAGDVSLSIRYSGDSQFEPSSETRYLKVLRGPTVDVLFIHTPAVGIYNLSSFVNSTIDGTNKILRDSLVKAEVRSAGLVQVSYTESSSLSRDLDRLADFRDGYVDNVNSLRDQYGADVVCLLVGDVDTEVVGIAMTPNTRDALRTSKTPFIVMQTGYSSAVFAHEFAHIFGAKHDYDSDEVSVASDAYGYSFNIGTETYTDIMSYRDGTHLPYYSNPDVIYEGVPVGRTGRSNVARVISEWAPTISGYRPSKLDRAPAGAVTLSASAYSGTAGQRITLTATASGAGRVELLSGSNWLGSVDLQNGAATFQATLADVGTQDFHAAYYPPSASNPGAVSNVLNVAVAGAALLDGGVLRITGTPSADSVSATAAGGLVQLSMNGVTTSYPLSGIQFVVVATGDGDDVIDIRAIERAATIMAGSGNDVVIGSVADDSISAGLGNDTVYANFGADSVDGGDGLDQLYGQWGDDTVIGGAGADMISGEDGHDLLYGGDGNDTVLGHAGRDTLYGNFDQDSLLGGGDADSLLGGLGADNMGGGEGNDSLWGGDQTDVMSGGIGNDYMEGKGKADTLRGGAGNDTILGQAGNDLVYGDEGDDEIQVYDNVDVFRDTVYAGAGQDRVAFDVLDTVLEQEVDLLA